MSQSPQGSAAGGTVPIPMGDTRAPTRRQLVVAYLQVVLAGCLWATSGPFSVLLHRMGLPPESVALLRPAAGAVFLVLFMTVGRGERRMPSKRTFLGMFLGGGVIVATFHMAFQLSTEAIGIPATVALLYLAPALVIASSAVLFREPLTAARGMLAGASVLGVWLTVFGSRGADVLLSPRGVAWGLVSGVAYASYILFGKGLGGRLGPLIPLLWSTLGGVGILVVTWAVRGDPLILPQSAGTWGILLVFGFLTVTASSLLLFHAMRTLEAGRAAIGTTVEPLVATILALLLLDQALTAVGWLGLAFLTFGVAGAYALPVPPVSDREAPGSRPPRRRPPGSGC